MISAHDMDAMRDDDGASQVVSAKERAARAMCLRLYPQTGTAKWRNDPMMRKRFREMADLAFQEFAKAEKAE